ncbi:paraquat-inducible protein A [Desulfocurvus sp. DL9XJH121]
MKASLVACHECDLLHRVRALPDGGVARCTRCGAVLYRRRDGSLEQVLALTLAGLVLFAVANWFPFLSMRLEANLQETTLLTGIRQLAAQGMGWLAALVLATGVAAPLLRLVLLLYVTLPLYLGKVPPLGARAFRLALMLQPWAMMEVFLLGILVAMVKLSSMADILIGPALYAFAFLILVLAGITSSLDQKDVWDRMGTP